MQSARSWLESYEGNKAARDYRRRYGVAWETAFTELEMLDVPLDPVYRERVLLSNSIISCSMERFYLSTKTGGFQTPAW